MLSPLLSGRAIVTTESRGCRETVPRGDNGILVPVRSPKTLASAMITLAEDSDLRARMGRKSRELAESRFDADVVASDIMNALAL